MVSADRFSVYLGLQKLVLEGEDLAEIFGNSLKEIYSRFNLLGYSLDFLGVVVLSETNTVLQSIMVKSDVPADKPLPPVEQAIDLKLLLEKDSQAVALLAQGKTVVMENIQDLLTASVIPSIIISPAFTVSKTKIWLVLASQKNKKEFAGEDWELISMVTNLITITYRFQETQNSLTNISQEVYKANAQLHQLDKLKDDFVSVASHELRTPMTAIRSYAWMALYRADEPLTPKMQKYVTRIFISTERLINLVNDMLNISRIESGRVEITPKSFDMKQLTDEVFSEISAKAAEKSLHVTALNTQIPVAFGDPDKVHQVLLNLLGNALKFTPVNGNITVSYFSDGKMLEVWVKDSGVGISKDDMSHLFKKFGRLDSSYVAAATSGGTGLGLYICKSLIELMKGRIWVESEGAGKGSTFKFSVPVATPEVVKEAEKYATKVDPGSAKTLEPVAI